MAIHKESGSRDNSILYGPFSHAINHADVDEVIETHGSRVVLDKQKKVAVKQRKEGAYESSEVAYRDQVELRYWRDIFNEYMLHQSPTDTLPDVFEVIHAAPGQPEKCVVSWISPLVRDAKPLAAVSLREFAKLSPKNIQILLDIIAADLKLFRENSVFMDIIGSSVEPSAVSQKLLRWGVGVLWSKNIVLGHSEEPSESQLIAFVDREGRKRREVNPSFTKMLAIELYPLRLRLSELFLHGLLVGAKITEKLKSLSLGRA